MLILILLLCTPSILGYGTAYSSGSAAHMRDSDKNQVTEIEADVQELPLKITTLKPDEYAEDVVVVFKGTFKCPRENFCASIYYYEEDSFWSPNSDFVIYVPLHCTRTRYLKHDAIINLKHNAGWTEGKTFEPVFKIFHDCEDIGVLRTFEIKLPRIDRYKQFHEIFYTEDLSRRGVPPYKPRIDFYYEYYSKWGYKHDPVTTEWKHSYDVTRINRLFYHPLVYFSKDFKVDGNGTIEIMRGS